MIFDITNFNMYLVHEQSLCQADFEEIFPPQAHLATKNKRRQLSLGIFKQRPNYKQTKVEKVKRQKLAAMTWKNR